MSKTSYVAAEDPVVDLEISQQMAAELEDYIVKDELYRAMTVRTTAGEERDRTRAARTVASTNTKATNSDNGIAAATTMVARKRRRNHHSTDTAGQKNH